MPFYGDRYPRNPRRDAALRSLYDAEKKHLLTRKECAVWRCKINQGKYDWKPNCLK